MRACKRKLIAADETGDDDTFTDQSIRLRRLREYYDDFSRKAQLPTQHDRAQVLGYGRSISGKAVAAERKAAFVILRSVGAKAKNYEIIDKRTGIVYTFVEGQRIRDPEVFAGYKGTDSLKTEVAEGLAREFGGSPNKWQHAKGTGLIDVEGKSVGAEVHWFQEESVGKVKFFIKKWLE